MAKKKVRRKSAREMVEGIASRSVSPEAAASSGDFRTSSVIAPEGAPERVGMSQDVKLDARMRRGGNLETMIDPETGNEIVIASVGDASVEPSRRKKVKRKSRRSQIEQETERSALMMLEARRLEEERKLGRSMDSALRGL